MELYSGVKNKFQRTSFIKVLTAIVAATVDPNRQFDTIAVAQYEKMVAAEPSYLLKGNVLGSGETATIQVKASDAVIAAVQALPPVVAAVKNVIVPGSIAIESGIEVPEVKRGNVRTSAYPFAQLEIGQSFFMPVTETMPNPAKTLATVVSSATRRYKTATPARVFTIRAVNDADGKLTGARIWRINPKDATAAQASGSDSTAAAPGFAAS